MSEKKFLTGTLFLFAMGLFPTFVGIRQYLAPTPGFNVYYHVAFTNLITVGISIITVTYFGLWKTQSKWSWYFLLFILIWTPTNDLYAIYRSYLSTLYNIRVPIFPIVTGSIGLFLTFSKIFKKETREIS